MCLKNNIHACTFNVEHVKTSSLELYSVYADPLKLSTHGAFTKIDKIGTEIANFHYCAYSS